MGVRIHVKHIKNVKAGGRTVVREEPARIDLGLIVESPESAMDAGLFGRVVSNVQIIDCHTLK